MRFKIEVTKQYLKDLKLARKRGLNERKLNDVIRILSEGGTLPAKNKDHALVGNFAGIRECHITPDWFCCILKIRSFVSCLWLGMELTPTYSDKKHLKRL